MSNHDAVEVDQSPIALLKSERTSSKKWSSHAIYGAL
jgi:hypothetical protein